MADPDPLAADLAMREIGRVWEDLAGFCEAALREAPKVDPAVLGIPADDLAALTHQLEAVLDHGALYRIEAAAQDLSAAVTLAPTALVGQPGAGEAELAFLGAVMMIRGQLATLEDSRRGDGPNAIPLPALNVTGTACDFCPASAPAWYFPAEPFEMLHGSAEFGDRWWACAACKPLVEATDWKALGARNGFPWPLPQTIKVDWLMFARHRRGEALPAGD
jgi:hypothetical protein